MRVFLLLLLFPALLFAQEYEVTPSGLFNKQDNSLEYVIINAADMPANDIYKKAKLFMLDRYDSPDKAIVADVEGEVLRAKTFIANFTKVNNGGINLDVDATYDLELKFKDGKVKLSIINLSITEPSQGRAVAFKGSIWKGYPIYNNKEKLRLPDTKEAIESHFNGLINDLKSNLNNNEDEKW